MEKKRIGKLGEDIASQFFVKRGFTIKDRNYLKKWGEIDVIAEKEGKVHFIEVKTVSHVPYGGLDSYRPEENVHPWKLKRLSRVIQTYILDKKLFDAEWQFDVVAVFLDEIKREAKVKIVENIIIE